MRCIQIQLSARCYWERQRCSPAPIILSPHFALGWVILQPINKWVQLAYGKPSTGSPTPKSPLYSKVLNRKVEIAYVLFINTWLTGTTNKVEKKLQRNSRRKASEGRIFPSTLISFGTSGTRLTAALKKASATKEIYSCCIITPAVVAQSCPWSKDWFKSVWNMTENEPMLNSKEARDWAISICCNLSDAGFSKEVATSLETCEVTVLLCPTGRHHSFKQIANIINKKSTQYKTDSSGLRQ